MVEDDFYEKVEPTPAGARQVLDRYQGRRPAEPRQSSHGG
jgi:hypothetical protein